MRRTVLGVSSVVFAAVCALPNAASAQEVEIKGFAANGSGCPLDSVASLISGPPGELPNTLTLLFSEFIAQQGPSINASERRKNCSVAINLEVPQGFSFSLIEAEYKGFADLPSGVSGVQRTTYSFPFSNRAAFQTVLNGPFTDDYLRTDELGAAVFSPCRATVPLNLESQVFLRGNAKPQAMMTLDRNTTRVTQVYHFQWKRC